MVDAFTYQFPLNETARSYLRIEHLLLRCTQAMQALNEQAFLSYFSALFDLLELLERADVRQDLIKDLEGQQKELARWATYPNVDLDALKQLDQSNQHCLSALRSQSRLANCLKSDKFLSGIRQRFSIPGGNCCFDLPQLYYWMSQDSESCLQDMNRWLSQLDILANAIGQLMHLTRDGKLFQPAVAKKGFYQASAENLQLLRIRVSSDSKVFPTVSGNKHRFTVRFMRHTNNGTAATEQDIEFLLSAS
ncbi:cell division protein ZapD [Neiella marina]|uniref:Cell division protein ZapD n=1 Tax=Neiella holothuriorum TaxID=2870530 RepID=A0ABS7ECU5_9GAMM|nr:cell division protein ZapD [Neiella holothuriorum]MBW8189547.1 cell division protein ZapD [Neiella holothuriorum]